MDSAKMDIPVVRGTPPQNPNSLSAPGPKEENAKKPRRKKEKEKKTVSRTLPT